MGERRKGVKIHKKFLTCIIPDHWVEEIYEFQQYYACEVKGEKDEKRFKEIVSRCRYEFGDNLLEVFSVSADGAKFIVYLKKTL
jgi:hypothetical protein